MNFLCFTIALSLCAYVCSTLDTPHHVVVLFHSCPTTLCCSTPLQLYAVPLHSCSMLFHSTPTACPCCSTPCCFTSCHAVLLHATGIELKADCAEELLRPQLAKYPNVSPTMSFHVRCSSPLHLCVSRSSPSPPPPSPLPLLLPLPLPLSYFLQCFIHLIQPFPHFPYCQQLQAPVPIYISKLGYFT